MGTGASCMVYDCPGSSRAWCDRSDHRCKCIGGCATNGACSAPTAPTPEPTAPKTDAPTAAPTKAPTAPPTEAPTQPPTEPPTHKESSRLCKAHAGCASLSGPYCCPNRDGVKLYCCD